MTSTSCEKCTFLLGGGDFATGGLLAGMEACLGFFGAAIALAALGRVFSLHTIAGAVVEGMLDAVFGAVALTGFGVVLLRLLAGVEAGGFLELDLTVEFFLEDADIWVMAPLVGGMSSLMLRILLGTTLILCPLMITVLVSAGEPFLSRVLLGTTVIVEPLTTMVCLLRALEGEALREVALPGVEVLRLGALVDEDTLEAEDSVDEAMVDENMAFEVCQWSG